MKQDQKHDSFGPRPTRGHGTFPLLKTQDQKAVAVSHRLNGLFKNGAKHFTPSHLFSLTVAYEGPYQKLSEIPSKLVIRRVFRTVIRPLHAPDVLFT